jgi:hypothetical protein
MGTNAAVTVATPAPETIQEFKVQTSLYDATYGRSGGGNIQVVTRSGGNEFHGAAYEYFRNDALNANNPFLKAAGVRRPVLRRNVFGGMLGGPIRKNTAFLFLSYQGTRETNGASAINSLSSDVLITPCLTNDRSEATLLATCTPKLSNGQLATAIDPAALALLNATLPNGQFAIPTPQAKGRYSGSTPSIFQEDQFNANLDWRAGQSDFLTVKFFFANAPQTLTLPSFRGTGPNVPGFGNDQVNNNRVVAIQHVHTFRSNLLNEVRAGYTFIRNNTFPQEPIKDSDVGIGRSTANQYPGLPLIRIAPAAGGVIIGTAATIDGAVALRLLLAERRNRPLECARSEVKPLDSFECKGDVSTAIRNEDWRPHTGPKALQRIRCRKIATTVAITRIGTNPLCALTIQRSRRASRNWRRPCPELPDFTHNRAVSSRPRQPF